MNSIVKVGRSVEEATREALEELGVGAHQVDVEVLQEGSKGLFGLLGTKPAKVRVTMKEQLDTTQGWFVGLHSDASGDEGSENVTYSQTTEKQGVSDRVAVEERASGFLKEVLERMGVEVRVAFDKTRSSSDDQILFNLSGPEVGLLIGRRGQTLDALQYLVMAVAHRGARGVRYRILLDAEGYRERREESLRHLALRTAARVKALRRKVALEPMSAGERRIIHMTLQDRADVTTLSEGEGPYRHVVVAPRDNGGQGDSGASSRARGKT